jgi:glycosyltransferase involved in cell wall biosynthesis
VGRGRDAAERHRRKPTLVIFYIFDAINSPDMPLLSVVISTLNEERNIARCLESVKDIADDIVVVDSGSADRTEEICREFHVRFFRRKWQGYSEQKNYANSLAKHDWIFSIDADEAVSPELQADILEIRKNPAPGCYRIRRITNYCGKWIRHGGWYPDIKLRFFDRRISKWEGSIHEKLSNVSEKTAPLLRGDCYHYSYYSTSTHIAQASHFALLAAMELFSKGKKAGQLKPTLAAIHKFVRGYVFQLGFLDGHYGWTIALISARAVYFKYSKLREFHDGRQA